MKSSLQLNLYCSRHLEIIPLPQPCSSEIILHTLTGMIQFFFFLAVMDTHFSYLCSLIVNMVKYFPLLLFYFNLVSKTQCILFILSHCLFLHALLLKYLYCPMTHKCQFCQVICPGAFLATVSGQSPLPQWLQLYFSFKTFELWTIIFDSFLDKLIIPTASESLIESDQSTSN